MKKAFTALLAAALLCGCGSKTTSTSTTSTGTIYADDEGYAEGTFGDTFSTKWFDFTVNSAEIVDSYGTLKGSDGYVYLVVNTTITNTCGETIPMFANDFQITWGDGNDDYAAPINSMLDLNTQENMFATEYELAADETKTGDSVFKVPEGNTYFAYSFLEYLDDNTTGDIFVVYFDLSE